MLQQQVIHADGTPMTVMQIARNKPKKGYVWDYTTTLHNPIQAVIYDFQLSRAGQHAEDFLISWQDHLVCDDYSDFLYTTKKITH